MFGLAALFAVGGGIDVISVTRDLWRNPDTRAILVQRVDELASNDPPPTATEMTTDANVSSDAIQGDPEEVHRGTPSGRGGARNR